MGDTPTPPAEGCLCTPWETGTIVVDGTAHAAIGDEWVGIITLGCGCVLMCCIL
jgi:hypothetical protein